ncbi:hypothetical protein JNM05_12280 [bacterium]|nr:hypothetical protein [bacterium]
MALFEDLDLVVKKVNLPPIRWPLCAMSCSRRALCDSSKKRYFIIYKNRMMSVISREHILLALQSSLIGNVHRSLRAVAFKYQSDVNIFTLRFYLSNSPSKEDYERVSVVMTEFISHFKFSDFSKLQEECVFSNDQLSALEPLDGFVFARSEE